MRLIDADALMNEKVWLAEISEDARVFRFAVPCGVIANAPTIDAEPVKYGRWKFKNNGRYGQTRCYCTACGKHSGIGGIRENQMKPYCPNCGAKMDKEGE